MEIRPLEAPFGCEVLGLEINAGVAPAAYKAVRAAFEAYSVVVIRGEALTDESQVAFSEMFGPCERTLGANPAITKATARPIWARSSDQRRPKRSATLPQNGAASAVKTVGII